MNHKAFKKVTSYINQSIKNKQLPGAAVGVVTSDGLAYVHASGNAHVPKGIPVKENTIFDLASLTKVVATLPAVLKLLEEGKLDLADPVHLYIPSFKTYHEDLTIKHLLCHTSGFQPGIKFYMDGLTMEQAVRKISQLRFQRQVETEVIYSDLNFITLGYIVEKITNMSLADYVKQTIYQPLGMMETDFNPASNLLNRIAATEYMESLKDYQWGTVHDENACHFNGVSGHAGLFSTIDDLAKFSQMILNGGTLNGTKLFSKQTIDLSVTCQTDGLNLRRGIGWQLYDDSSFSGTYLQNGFGHTGFTGTSLWFDMERQFAVILLTNRVHFGRQTDISRFRRITHNLISLAMDHIHEG